MVPVTPRGNTMNTNGKDNLDYAPSLDMVQPDVFWVTPANGLPHSFYRGLSNRSHSVVGGDRTITYITTNHILCTVFRIQRFSCLSCDFKWSKIRQRVQK